MPGMPPYGPRWMQGEFLRPVRSFLSWLVLFSIHAIYLPAIYLSIYHYIILYTHFISRISVCLSWLVCLSEVIQSQVSNQAWNWLICASSWSGAKKNDMLEFHGISLYIYIARRWNHDSLSRASVTVKISSLDALILLDSLEWINKTVYLCHKSHRYWCDIIDMMRPATAFCCSPWLLAKHLLLSPHQLDSNAAPNSPKESPAERHPKAVQNLHLHMQIVLSKPGPNSLWHTFRRQE